MSICDFNDVSVHQRTLDALDGNSGNFLHQVKYQHWIVTVNCFIIRFELMEENSFQLPVCKVG